MTFSAALSLSFANPRPDRALEGSSSWMTRKPLEAMRLNRPTEPFTSKVKFSAMSCPLQPKPKQPDYSTTAKLPAAFAQSKKWAGRNPPLSLNATTLLLLLLPTTPSNPNAPKPWICASGGSEIASAKDNSRFSGPPEKPTRPITLPSIFRHLTILKSEVPTFILPTTWHYWNARVC